MKKSRSSAPLPTFADMRGILRDAAHEHTDSCFGPNYSHCPAPVECSGCDCPKDRCDSYGTGKKCCPDCNHSEAPSATEFAGPPGFRRERAPVAESEAGIVRLALRPGHTDPPCAACDSPPVAETEAEKWRKRAGE